MHISKVAATDFRRFTQLEIVDLPATAKLVVLAGPNGNGKSSLFDVFMHVAHRPNRPGWDLTYHTKILDQNLVPAPNRIDVAYYEELPADRRKLFYFRSAYRNDPEFVSAAITRAEDVLQERRFDRFIDNDVTVSSNYQRLYAQGMEDVFEREAGSTTIALFREKIIGDIQKNLKKVMPELTLDSLGNPFKMQTFRFSKGKAKGFNYKNLSGGEKAVFDLILDLTVKRGDFDNTIFCVDEPEAHLNARVHGKMLEVLMDLTPDNSQLWVATHSIGMMRRGRDLYHEKPGQVVFLDFEKDFDEPQVLRPTIPDLAFWHRSLAVALDDLADLVAPKLIVACEGGLKSGNAGEGFDAEIYNAIFAGEFPEARFISIGASTDMKGDRFLVIQAMANLVKGTKAVRLIDRDGMSEQERTYREAEGFRVLRKRHIEAYLFDDEILQALCAKVGQADKWPILNEAKVSDIAASVANGHPPDDIKSAAGRITVSCHKILQLTNAGKTSRAFMRDTLAPLVTADTATYRELRLVVFG
jgi:energy-coupling factor transporter ATP-binding protein EcfA2